MYNTTQDLLDAFAATPDTLRGVLRGCTHEQAAVARGGDENWSVCDSPGPNRPAITGNLGDETGFLPLGGGLRWGSIP